VHVKKAAWPGGVKVQDVAGYKVRMDLSYIESSKRPGEDLRRKAKVREE
jgi:hypothetical protein